MNLNLYVSIGYDIITVGNCSVYQQTDNVYSLSLYYEDTHSLAKLQLEAKSLDREQ